MKLLHITPTYFPAIGGAELHLKELSERLVRRGHEVTVYTNNALSHWDLWPGRSGGLPEKEIVNGVTVVRFSVQDRPVGRLLDRWVGLKGGWSTAGCVFGADGLEMLSQGPRTLSMVPQILNFNADIVASMNWYWPPAYQTYLAKKLGNFRMVGIPLFHTVHSWCDRTIYDRMLGSCEAVVVNTKHEGEFAMRRGAKRVEVPGVGIEPHLFEKRNGSEIRARYGLGNSPVVGFVGRQDAKKGAVKLVEAMRIVWRWNKDVRLALAGPRPPHENAIEDVLATLTDSEKARVIDIGAFDETQKTSIFDAFDVFVLPSKEESFGIAYLEAWMCGKPVVGARIPATQCVIEEGVDGLLADPDSSEDIAKAIVTLLGDSQMRARMGRNGLSKTVSQHTWEKVTDKVESLYLELAAKPVARSVWSLAQHFRPQTQKACGRRTLDATSDGQ